MCYLTYAPPVPRVLAGLVEIMGRTVWAAEALRGLQRRLSMRSAHRETQIAQETVRELGVRRHALVIYKADLRTHARLPALRDGGDGFDDENTLRLRWNYARALRENDGATLDDLRKAVTTLEETAPIARRVLGSSHPLALSIRNYLQDAHDSLRAREAPRAA